MKWTRENLIQRLIDLGIICEAELERQKYSTKRLEKMYYNYQQHQRIDTEISRQEWNDEEDIYG